MKVINVSKGEAMDQNKYTAKPFVNSSDRQSCWYVDCVMENDKLVWKVGITGHDAEEFTFDAEQDMRTLGFSMELLGVFKQGRTVAVEAWLAGKK